MACADGLVKPLVKVVEQVGDIGAEASDTLAEIFKSVEQRSKDTFAMCYGEEYYKNNDGTSTPLLDKFSAIATFFSLNLSGISALLLDSRGGNFRALSKEELMALITKVFGESEKRASVLRAIKLIDNQ